MHLNGWKKAAVVAGALVALVLTTAGSCETGDATNWDVTGIEGVRPDVVEGYANIDGHPNIVILCIHKVAWLTTSRQAGNNLLRVPEYDVPVCHGTPSPYAPRITGPAADPAPTPAG